MKLYKAIGKSMKKLTKKVILVMPQQLKCF